ncbi:MAG: HAD-IA family hydrolase [Chromatiaceae bacterium]|jgi:phosphoglycolate phosphatase
MRFSLIVFDWDGTLMDSEARIVSCIEHAFVDVGRSPPSRDQARNVIGLGLEEAMAVLWPAGSAAERRRLIESYRHRFLVGKEADSSLFPGAHEALEWLSDQGYLLAVATGKSRRGLDAAMASTGLTSRFCASRCADETFSKPHPEMLLQIMDELGVKAADTLMVGDTEYDMEMARNAGASALAVCHGVHERERLLRHRPLDCLASLFDVPSWFERSLAV